MLNMMGMLAVPFAKALSFLFDICGNYALSIIILSVIIRVAMYPLYKKQILSTAGMAEMQPKLRELQRKYANDKETLNAKMQELYKEEGVNPMAGCLPMVIQLLVISSLFMLLRNPIYYINSEQMYFAIHESFFWIKDLSQPDPWILPIASGVATFFSFYLSSQNQLTQQGGNMMQIVMKYVFPILIVWLARSYPSGLAIYWFISQFLQIFFNIRFNKIRENMKKNKMKTKHKKSMA